MLTSPAEILTGKSFQEHIHGALQADMNMFCQCWEPAVQHCSEPAVQHCSKQQAKFKCCIYDDTPWVPVSCLVQSTGRWTQSRAQRWQLSTKDNVNIPFVVLVTRKPTGKLVSTLSLKEKEISQVQFLYRDAFAALHIAIVLGHHAEPLF